MARPAEVITTVRWDFPDPADVEENRRRERVAAAMDWWWKEFVANKERLSGAFSRGGRNFDVAGFTNAGLNPIVDGLCWEYGPALRKRGHRLVITPEGDHALRPLVRELLRRAPELPDWEFYPGRLPEPPETAFAVADQIARFKPSGDVFVKVALGEFRRIDLTFHVPNAHEDETGATTWIFRATEQMLGEEILDHWLGVIELAPPPTRAQRLLKRRPPGTIGPDRLKPTVDALIAASLEQLPEVPPRLIAQKDYNDPRLRWCTLTREPEQGRDDYPQRDDMFYIGTCEEELAKAEANDPLFSSRRFSRTGETFAYLKLDRRGDAARGSVRIESAKERAEVEEAVNAALGEQGAGCTTGGGSGLIYAYVDLALTDVRRAIPILRELLQRRRVNERSWLLFFEPELADEWIGIYSQTPPPPPRPAEEPA